MAIQFVTIQSLVAIFASNGVEATPGDLVTLTLDVDSVPGLPQTIQGVVQPPVLRISMVDPERRCPTKGWQYSISYDSAALDGVLVDLRPDDVLSVAVVTCCDILQAQVDLLRSFYDQLGDRLSPLALIAVPVDKVIAHKQRQTMDFTGMVVTSTGSFIARIDHNEGMGDDTLVVDVALLTTDTPAQIAQKYRNALAADVQVQALFTVSFAGNLVTIERLNAGNDGSLAFSTTADSGGATGIPNTHTNEPGVGAVAGTAALGLLQPAIVTHTDGTITTWDCVQFPTFKWQPRGAIMKNLFTGKWDRLFGDITSGQLEWEQVPNQ